MSAGSCREWNISLFTRGKSSGRSIGLRAYSSGSIISQARSLLSLMRARGCLARLSIQILLGRAQYDVTAAL